MVAMEITIVDKDIRLICKQALSFPEGIGGAFKELEQLVGDVNERIFYGLSRPEGGKGIVYKAALTELFDGEAEQLQAECFVVKKGNYISETILNWHSDEKSIGNAFKQLLQDQRIDFKDGICVERYLNDKDVICMVRLDPEKM